MRRTVRNVLVTAAFAAAGVLVAPGASAAIPIKYCDAGIVWQDAFVRGNSELPLSPNCHMQQGGGGVNAVQTLQSSLRDCHGKNITVDGIFGPRTRQALVEVQRALRIAADGMYGPQTARAMSHTKVGGGCKRITF
jgi:hypothetical protein